MTITQLAAWVMLAYGGLFSGAIFIYAVDRVITYRWNTEVVPDDALRAAADQILR